MRRAEEDIPMDKKNKAVVTVVGNDTIGIIARVSAALAAHEREHSWISLRRCFPACST